jgi:hypothetical protein
MAKWIRIKASEVPNETRFDTPGREQGQICQVAYGGPLYERTEHTASDAPFKKVSDFSCPEGDPERIVYYRRV